MLTQQVYKHIYIICFEKKGSLTISSLQMLTQQVYRTAAVVGRRNFGASAVVLAKATDPIQQLFIEKVREYNKKSA